MVRVLDVLGQRASNLFLPSDVSAPLLCMECVGNLYQRPPRTIHATDDTPLELAHYPIPLVL